MKEFFDKALQLKILKPVSGVDARIALTGYPQGLPSWEVQGGAAALRDVHFWREYDEVLKGFIDFYRTFFSQVSTHNAPMLPDVYFPEQVESVLLFNNDFMKTAKKVRDHCIIDAKYATPSAGNPRSNNLSTATMKANSSSPSARTLSATPSPNYSVLWSIASRMPKPMPNTSPH